MNLIPGSWGSPLREFNKCHEPAGRPTGGRFTFKGQGDCAHEVQVGQKTTIAHLTSARPSGDPHHRPNRQVAAEMRALETRLKAIPTVNRVSVKPAQGQWADGAEFSWVASFVGNGEARRALAETAKAWNQDAVLLLSRAKAGEEAERMFEFTFERPVGVPTRQQLAPLMSAYGLGGWTWYKRGGKTTLRMGSVPRWGGNAKAITESATQLAALLRGSGYKFEISMSPVKVEVMERDGEFNYDRWIRNAPAPVRPRKQRAQVFA